MSAGVHREQGTPSANLRNTTDGVSTRILWAGRQRVLKEDGTREEGTDRKKRTRRERRGQSEKEEGEGETYMTVSTLGKAP